MNSLKSLFLEQIADRIFPRAAQVQECVFKFRFNPNYENYPHSGPDRSYKGLEPTTIAGLVAKKLNGTEKYYRGSINQQVKEVVLKVYKAYKEEMEKDGITEDQLDRKEQKGRIASDEKSPWEITYNWLWNIKYPRWLPNHIWETWKEKAQADSQWIQFRDLEYASKGMNVPPPPPKEKLTVNTPLNMKINIEHPGRYLLLFNRGQDEAGNPTQYLITPSHAYAPSYQLVDGSIIMPQEGARCPSIQFNAIATEEYIGIVFENPLDLPWLNVDPQTPALEWQGQHLEQVWELLEQQENWQILYRDFEVASSEQPIVV